MSCTLRSQRICNRFSSFLFRQITWTYLVIKSIEWLGFNVLWYGILHCCTFRTFRTFLIWGNMIRKICVKEIEVRTELGQSLLGILQSIWGQLDSYSWKQAYCSGYRCGSSFWLVWCSLSMCKWGRIELLRVINW